MINTIKSTPPPECLEKESKKANGNYSCGDVLERLTNDFFNKCYLCEWGPLTSMNVDHFKPHKGDKDLKFDWDNLFLACPHCNGTKGGGYDNILNCTNAEHDVENWIKYEMADDSYIGEVKLTILKDKKIVGNTVKLLNEIYNGFSTVHKQAESSNIREILSRELAHFQGLLKKYYENVEDERKEYYFNKIKKHLRKSSAFTAFKRWIIKENPVFKKDFQHYFD